MLAGNMEENNDFPAKKGPSVTTDGITGYTFLVQSRASLGEDLSPGHDAGLAAKNKRRRTSPQDHAVLEAAYLKNSKPDKAERAEIVSRVQLGEKEVQIWFQNRRQNDRRRSKPLEPHELLAHFRNKVSGPGQTQNRTVSSSLPQSISNLLSSPLPSNPTNPIFDAQIQSLAKSDDNQDFQSSGETLLSDSSRLTQSTPPSTAEEKVTCSQESDDITHEENGNSPKDGMDQTEPSKKRPYDAVIEGSDAGKAKIAEDAPHPMKSKVSLTRSSSMHLSMTMDGSVKIRTDNEPTPSPPKVRAEAPEPNLNLHSGREPTTDSVNIFKDIPENRSTKQFGSGFGRSRDARTWEFYCDNTSNEALSTQAEAEATGSAIGAINLIRSNSSKFRTSLLNSNPSKGNTRKAIRSDKAGKPKLARCKSSMARLQGFENNSQFQDSEKRPQHFRSPSGDSDKENWAPGTRASENPLRRTQPSTITRPILRENEGVIFHDLTPVSQPPSARERVSPRKNATKGEDLDCIQGLLSLSQGAWK